MKPIIRAADLCQRVAIPQARHSQWVNKGLCRRIGKDGAARGDVVELAVATLLMDALKDIEKARRAMAQLRDRFGHAAWPDDLAIVWDEQLEFARWAGTDAEIGRLTRHGRPTRVISAGRTVSAILESYRQLDHDRAAP